MKIDSEAIHRLGESLRARESSAEEPHRNASGPTPEQSALMTRVAPMCEAMYRASNLDTVVQRAAAQIAREEQQVNSSND